MDEKVINEKPHKIWRKKYIHEVSPTNDIKYRGPLSYRHLRIFAWFFLALAQIGVILTLGTKLYHNPDMYWRWPSVLRNFSSLMSPLFLIASFSIMINAKNGYKRLLMMYGGVSLLILAAFAFIYEYYIVGTFAIVTDFNDANRNIQIVFNSFASEGFITFNVFIDLFLCTLIMFFVNYKPTKYFQGKLIIIFRLFVIFPILYELGSIALKILSSIDVLELSPLLWPLLTTKPPVAFTIFIFMAIFIKNREKHYLKHGKTHADYKKFLKTNVNALQFSIHLSIVIVVAAIVDLILTILLTAIVAIIKLPSLPDETEVFLYAYNAVSSWGFSKTLPMILIIPIILLFDYTKIYQDYRIDVLIPLVGIGVLAVIYIEGGYEVIKQYLVDLIKSSDKPEEETARLFINDIKYFFTRK